jgi:hypothetical protein
MQMLTILTYAPITSRRPDLSSQFDVLLIAELIEMPPAEFVHVIEVLQSPEPRQMLNARQNEKLGRSSKDQDHDQDDPEVDGDESHTSNDRVCLARMRPS